MKASRRTAFVVLGLAALAAGSLLLAGTLLPRAEEAPVPPAAAVGTTAVAAPLPVSRPVRVSFPDGSTAAVEPVGATRGGAMAVPADPAHAGWWREGPAPGQEGIAVLAGHSGWDGRDLAFSCLEDLRSGDEVTVRGKDGTSYRFAVREKHRYAADADAPEVFTGREGRWLNLVTCVGRWDSARGTHSQRLVVSCELVAE